MAAQKHSQVITFWIPFAGSNKAKLGTRINFEIENDPNLSSFFISVHPEKRQSRDTRLRNGGAGMEAMFNTLNTKVQGDKKQLRLFFNVFNELLIRWQRWQRGPS
ncbi:MAG: hypothetical protein HYZ63_02620 [Candidatus Andersenbacteria bacterium]|nr:hypothetical protein [Candidatus Andersenbacteria bacterium]